jgi:hypothetical protein
LLSGNRIGLWKKVHQGAPAISIERCKASISLLSKKKDAKRKRREGMEREGYV